MKCTIPEISWHNREPVLSVDIHPVSGDFYKLVSGGGDCHVLIWNMVMQENGTVKQELLSDLTRHHKAVNAVRWSPSGQYLASADDDGNIITWRLKTDNIPLLEDEGDNKETWIVYKVLRGHKEDIYDLSWSPSEANLVSGSIDNTAILWDVHKGKMEHMLSDHKGFVQGVSWDPKSDFIATISTDRTCRLFDSTGRQIKARISKGKVPVPPSHFFHEKEVKYFYNDTFKSFFRRLTFSPDGSLLVVPSGHMESEDCKKILNGTLAFTLDNLHEPSCILPLPKQSSTCVRFCPLLFQLREDGPEPFIKTPYRMIFAVGTEHDVILYDTQQIEPFARFQEIHYTRLTDLAWSKDGLLLIASSTDGFCALITFTNGELGVPYNSEESETEENKMDISNAEVEVTNKNSEQVSEEINKPDVKSKKNFIKQWVQTASQRIDTSDDKSIGNGILNI